MVLFCIFYLPSRCSVAKFTFIVFLSVSPFFLVFHINTSCSFSLISNHLVWQLVNSYHMMVYDHDVPSSKVKR
jgi:hypothetical protein